MAFFRTEWSCTSVECLASSCALVRKETYSLAAPWDVRRVCCQDYCNCLTTQHLYHPGNLVNLKSFQIGNRCLPPFHHKHHVFAKKQRTDQTKDPRKKKNDTEWFLHLPFIAACWELLGRSSTLASPTAVSGGPLWSAIGTYQKSTCKKHQVLEVANMMSPQSRLQIHRKK